MGGFCDNKTDRNEKPNKNKDPQCLHKDLNFVAGPHSWLWGICKEKIWTYFNGLSREADSKDRMMTPLFAKWRGRVCGDLRIFFFLSPWGFTCKFHCYLIRLILEEIYKAGEVEPRKLPRNFNSLSAKEQVSTLSTTAKQSFLFVWFFFTFLEISAQATGLSVSESARLLI